MIIIIIIIITIIIIISISFIITTQEVKKVSKGKGHPTTGHGGPEVK